MSDERMIETLTRAEKYLEGVITEFSLLRIDVLSSMGFLIATVLVIVIAHKTLRIIKKQKGLFWSTLNLYGVVVMSWVLGIAAVQALVFTPFGIPFEAAIGGFLTIFVLFLMLLSPFIITGFFILLAFMLSGVYVNYPRNRNNSAKGVFAKSSDA